MLCQGLARWGQDQPTTDNVLARHIPLLLQRLQVIGHQARGGASQSGPHLPTAGGPAMGLGILLNKAAQGAVPLTNCTHVYFPSSLLVVLAGARTGCPLPLGRGATALGRSWATAGSKVSRIGRQPLSHGARSLAVLRQMPWAHMARCAPPPADHAAGQAPVRAHQFKRVGAGSGAGPRPAAPSTRASAQRAATWKHCGLCCFSVPHASTPRPRERVARGGPTAPRVRENAGRRWTRPAGHQRATRCGHQACQSGSACR